MFRTRTMLLAASLSLVLISGCKQEATSPASAGDAASGMQDAIEKAEGDAKAAGAIAAAEAALKPGERVQGVIQLDIGNGAAPFRSLATKIDDDLGKKTAERLGSGAGQKDLADAKSKVGGSANVSSQDIQEMANMFAGKTVYTSQMYSLGIINQRGVELSGISADGRRVTLNISFPMDSDTPASTKLGYVPNGKKQMQSFETDRKADDAVQVAINRFERVDDHTMSIAGTFSSGKLMPGVLAKDLAGQEIAGASGSFDFTEVHVRPEN